MTVQPQIAARGSLVRIRREVISGQTVTVGSIKVTPQLRSLAVRLPMGTYFRSTPIGVVVEKGGGLERIPIRDVTRILERTLLCIAVLALLVRYMSISRKEKES